MGEKRSDLAAGDGRGIVDTLISQEGAQAAEVAAVEAQRRRFAVEGLAVDDEFVDGGLQVHVGSMWQVWKPALRLCCCVTSRFSGWEGQCLAAWPFRLYYSMEIVNGEWRIAKERGSRLWVVQGGRKRSGIC